MKTGIVGLGVMGGSFGARLKELGHEVIGIDLDEKTLEYALENGIIDIGSTDGSALADTDLILLCLYPTRIPGWIENNQKYLKKDAVIMEISGVKQPVVTPIHTSLREDLDLISIHPMCGRESKGIQFSSPRIFDKANFIVIPHETNAEEHLKLAEDLASELGCKNISRLTAQEHDQMIAFLSQLTHVIAVCLMNTHENEHLVEFSGDSFRELTRIAKINEKMWSELFLLNREILLDEIEAFETSLNDFKTALQNGQSEVMEERFVESTRRRKAFD